MTNLKLVLRTYSALRQMSPDDIALLETLRGLNDGDRELMVETLQGKATARKASKKSSTSKSSQSETERVFKRCDTCGLTKRADVHKDSELGGYHEFVEKKSPRASGMAAQLKERRSEQRRISTEDVDAAFCAAPDCGEGLTNPIHDPNGGYGSYHPFVGSVPPAPASSPANGASSATKRSTQRSAPPSTPESDDREERSALSSGVNSEIGKADAGTA